MAEKITVNSKILDHIEDQFLHDIYRTECGYDIIKELRFDMPYVDASIAPGRARAYLETDRDCHFKIQKMQILYEGPAIGDGSPEEIIKLKLWNVSTGYFYTRGDGQGEEFIDIRTIAKPGQVYHGLPNPRQTFYEAGAVPFPVILKYGQILGGELVYYHSAELTKHCSIVFSGATVKRSSLITGVIDGD
jgi:hypothetical protein